MGRIVPCGLTNVQSPTARAGSNTQLMVWIKVVRLCASFHSVESPLYLRVDVINNLRVLMLGAKQDYLGVFADTD